MPKAVDVSINYLESMMTLESAGRAIILWPAARFSVAGLITFGTESLSIKPVETSLTATDSASALTSISPQPHTLQESLTYASFKCGAQLFEH